MQTLERTSAVMNTYRVVAGSISPDFTSGQMRLNIETDAPSAITIASLVVEACFEPLGKTTFEIKFAF